MHIPDNYLSPQTAAVMTAAMVPVWGIAIKKVRDDLTAEKITESNDM
jgi:cobalt/nickel transport system permease protein